MSPVRTEVLDLVELTAASGRWPRGTEGAKPDEPIGAQGKAFAEITRGVHW